MRGLRDGLLSVLPGMLPIRAEPARRGAGKGCYGKLCCSSGTKKPPKWAAFSDCKLTYFFHNLAYTAW